MRIWLRGVGGAQSRLFARAVYQVSRGAMCVDLVDVGVGSAEPLLLSHAVRRVPGGGLNPVDEAAAELFAPILYVERSVHRVRILVDGWRRTTVARPRCM